MTGMKKIFLNSSYKRAGYIHKSPRNKLFGTSNCKSLSILSSQSSLGNPWLHWACARQRGSAPTWPHFSARPRTREVRAAGPGGAGAGRHMCGQSGRSSGECSTGHHGDTVRTLGMRWYQQQDGGHHTLLGAQISSLNTQQNMWYVPQVTRYCQPQIKYLHLKLLLGLSWQPKSLNEEENKMVYILWILRSEISWNNLTVSCNTVIFQFTMNLHMFLSMPLWDEMH